MARIGVRLFKKILHIQRSKRFGHVTEMGNDRIL
jgi:hypothetical protein